MVGHDGEPWPCYGRNENRDEVGAGTDASPIAAAAIPQYVILNLVDLQIEAFEAPVPSEGRYAQAWRLGAGDTLAVHVGGPVRVDVAVTALLP